MGPRTQSLFEILGQTHRDVAEDIGRSLGEINRASAESPTRRPPIRFGDFRLYPVPGTSLLSTLPVAGKAEQYSKAARHAWAFFEVALRAQQIISSLDSSLLLLTFPRH